MNEAGSERVVKMGMPPVEMLLVGAGYMGKTHLEAARELETVRFVGIVDQDAPRAEALASEFGVKSFAVIECALEELRPVAVDLCTPTSTHLPLLKLCASHGIHALCEKPLALSLKDAREAGRIGSRIRVMVAQVLRFWPEYEHLIDLCRSGTFGQALHVACQRLSSMPRWNSWMTRADVGGGAVLDLQIHDLDFILQLLGRPIEIQAWGSELNGSINAVRSWLRFRSGAHATTEASYLMPDSYPFRMWFSIEMEEAVAEMDSWRPKGERLRIHPKHGDAFSPKLAIVDPYGAEIEYFVRCLETGEPFGRVPLEESIEAVELCLASARSCRTGKAVRP
jgi:UDP-N-acetylglucosamine 3-dehydrogenase